LSERTHYIRENKGGFEFFHAISMKGSLVQGLVVCPVRVY